MKMSQHKKINCLRKVDAHDLINVQAKFMETFTFSNSAFRIKPSFQLNGKSPLWLMEKNWKV